MEGASFQEALRKRDGNCGSYRAAGEWLFLGKLSCWRRDRDLSNEDKDLREVVNDDESDDRTENGVNHGEEMEEKRPKEKQCTNWGLLQ